MTQAIDRDHHPRTGPRAADSELHGWIARRVLDTSGEPVGVVVDIYGDGTDRRPAWLAISTGLLETPIAVPAHGASQVGDEVIIAHDRHTVFTAPGDAALLVMDPTAARAIASHYALRRPRAARSLSPNT